MSSQQQPEQTASATLAKPVTSLTNENLVAVRAQNQKLGNFPVVTLKDGSKVATGTIGMMLQNIRSYDAFNANPDPSHADQAEMKKLEGELEAAVPTLHKAGFWSLFPAEEWVAEGRPGVSAGRRYIGRYEMAKAKERQLDP